MDRGTRPSRSYYSDLLAAGVRIYEYEGGLLHTKSLTLDGEVTLIGSANMDRRSFDLNYENNILFYDPTLTAEMRRRQDAYLACSHPVTRRDGGPMADDPPALEQHHCDVGANFVGIDRPKQRCTSNFKPSSRCCR